ncbi:septum formation initiator family protein [Peptoniphilus equinus]|uniref:Septum formation initiator family protein n=1 Tax=Peptoniphilus equinus TaxID=3016343 RepID=A0ABY7QTR1_9FIRM|nr:septum formation initiator family protein [Peptoniphilus equinus]WBW49273.1 septum formation initiator family protein [Peptoniphilus equinus]
MFKVKVKVKKNRNQKKPLYLTLAIVIIMILGVAISYGQLSGLDKELMALESEITELKKNKVTLEADIMGIKNSKDIQEAAMYKLGMVYPNENQIVYIDISEQKATEKVKYNVFLSPILSVLKSFDAE